MTPKSMEAAQDSGIEAETSNHTPAGQLHPVRKEPERRDRTSPEEREAYCHSEFAVNGIIHDVDAIGAGLRLLTVLVNRAGLYKSDRLYVTPDGDFFRVRILVTDNPHSHRLRLGGRYIIMGQIYQRRMELPGCIQRAVSGQVRVGDGLLTSGGSFIRRYNRKVDGGVLGAAHFKCK